MALYQNNNREIRYLKNTEREQKIIGNYYRDIIRQYGIDVNYYKLKIPYLEQFKTIVDHNSILRHAYGYEEEMDYSLSSNMISYMEVQDDLLQLDKYGIVPNTTVNFWFDREDFAISFAQKFGQLKEYKVKEKEIVFDVPSMEGEISDGYLGYTYDDETWTYSLTDEIFPYAYGFNVPETFETEILSGTYTAVIEPYEYDKTYTIVCNINSQSDVKLEIPTNEWTANSFKRKFKSDELVETMLFLTYKVTKVYDTPTTFRSVLSGYLHGGVLFNDVYKTGKYMDLIHPEVGDILTISFPDEKSRQQYEITECTDKRIANDGINPLLGKYVWLCKAKRHVASGEEIPEMNEDDERHKEAMDFLDTADEVIAKKIADYDDYENDDVYGGYERKPDVYDRKAIKPHERQAMKNMTEDEVLEIFSFYDGSQLVTDGYELFYKDTKDNYYRITTTELDCGEESAEQEKAMAPTGLQYIKATDNALFFINFDNNVCRICEDPEITQGEIELCLNSLLDISFESSMQNRNGQCFFKFKDSKTVLISVNDCLYCRFGNKNGHLIKIA